MNKHEELQQIKTLLDNGALTQQEYEQQKQEIIKKVEYTGTKPQKNKLKIMGIVLLILGAAELLGTVLIFHKFLREATEWAEQYGIVGVNGMVLEQSPISYAFEQVLIFPPLYLTILSLVVGVILVMRSKRNIGK